MAWEIVAKRPIKKPRAWDNLKAIALAKLQYDAGTHETALHYNRTTGFVYFKKIRRKESVAPRAWFSCHG